MSDETLHVVVLIPQEWESFKLVMNESDTPDPDLDGDLIFSAEGPTPNGIRSEFGREGGKQRKPPRRNPKLKAWIEEHGAGRTAGAICYQLETKTPEALFNLIGQSEPPSLSTCQRIQKERHLTG